MAIRPIAILVALCGALLAGGACGGGSTAANTTGGGAGPSDPEAERMQMWKDRQDAACQVVGERITACSVADARATMSEAELAELELENTAPRHTAEFVAKCRSARMSPRQVRVYEVCPAEESECEAFLSCMDNANGSR